MGFHIPTGKDFKIEKYFTVSDFTVYVKLHQLKTFRLFYFIPIKYWDIVKTGKNNKKDYWEKSKAIEYIKTTPLSKWDKLKL